MKQSLSIAEEVPSTMALAANNKMRFKLPMSAPHALALVDQTVVSGASFLTTVMVGRWADSSQLGIFAIGLSLLVSVFAVQESLISLPYTIHRQAPLGTAAEHAGNSLVHSGLLSALCAAALVAAALGLSANGTEPEMAAMSWTMAGVAPFLLLREFGRRLAFAHLHMTQALALDAAVAVIQISLLGWLGLTGRMSAVMAFGALGAACALPVAVWLFHVRHGFAIRRRRAWAVLAKNWSLGKWLLAAQLTVQVQTYITYWLCIAILGAAATGVYAASMSIASSANPFISGFTNLMAPSAVLAWKNGGGRGLRARAIRDSLVLGGAMGLFCIGVVLAGGDLIGLLFHGREYEGQGHLVTVLTVAIMASVVGSPASNALAASLLRPHAILWASSFGAVVTVFLVWSMMIGWGLLGAAYGLLIGNVAGSISRWAAFLAVVPGSSNDSAAVARVLGKFLRNPDGRNWDISRLGEGTHSVVHLVRPKDRLPACPGRDSLAIKMFKAQTALSVQMAHSQFESLSRLHAALDRRVVNGWKIFVPKPLHVCESPPALIMTAVSGTDLNSWIAAREKPDPSILDEIARSTVGAIRECWARNQVHGDLALQNIVCNAANKHLSFIDPGTLECCRVCSGYAARWTPAVYDIAHIVSDVATNVRQSAGDKGACARRLAFAASAVRACIETAPSRGQRQQLLDEIEDCAHAHLQDLLKLSWSPRGVWRRCVKYIASRRIGMLLARQRAGLDAGGAVL